MDASSKYITPFLKQCFVTTGVNLHMWQIGLILGYPANLLRELGQPNSPIPIDDSSGSWIAAVIAVSILPSTFFVSFLMGKYGRKIANITGIIAMLIGWLIIATADNVISLLIARILQGLSMGMISILAPVLIGEYTSPRNRGAFLTTISVASGSGTLCAHAIGFIFNWRVTAFIFMGFCILNLLIVFYSPESPSWLIDQERYDESKKVFRWLRGDGEEDELKKIIDATVARKLESNSNESQSFLKRTTIYFTYLSKMIKKREFYMPIIITLHTNTIPQWSGVHSLSAYIDDTVQSIVGKDANISLIIISIGIHRVIVNTLSVYIIRKLKRRTMFFLAIGLNLSILLVISAYSYAKANDILPFDHQAIGIVLLHILIFSIATGAVPLPFIIAGELFPLEYRSLASGISSIFLAPNLLLPIKSLPFLYNTIGLHGTYLLYAGIIGYCLLVTGLLLPETKDRTLQDIEDEFRGKVKTIEEMKPLQSLSV